MHALMIRHNDQWSVKRDIMWVFKTIGSTQYMGTTHEAKIQQGYTYAVGVITKKIKTDPLNGVEHQKGRPKKNQV